MPEKPHVNAGFDKLTLNDPVLFASEACLIVRRPGSSCGICRGVCPTAALAGTEWSISIEPDRCIGCGFCAAACPTGALQVDGCSPLLENSVGESILLECRRVGLADRHPDAIAVACLGGLTAVDLLDAVVGASERNVVLVDRGWCKQCAVADCAAPWQSALDESRSLLNSVEASLGARLLVETKPLPVDRAGPIIASLRPDKQVARRDFLRRFAGMAKTPASREESRRIVFGRGHITPLRQQRIIELLEVVAEAHQQPLPPKLRPSVKVRAGCDLNGVCAAICPSGALHVEATDDQLELRFSSADCIACGLCERGCPSKALSFCAQGDGGLVQGEVIVARRPISVCAGCGESFPNIAGSTFCPACEKSMTIMQALSALKLRPRAVHADPMPAGAGEEDQDGRKRIHDEQT